LTFSLWDGDSQASKQRAAGEWKHSLRLSTSNQKEGQRLEQVQTAAEALARLEQPFASKDVKWLVAATSKDGRKGRVTPYADPRAYTDRLNLVFTASGWTREYTVQTLAPITRLKNDKPIQSGKVLVTCVVSIPSVGAHSGCGEQWAEDPNALTSAEAQAFKRACSNFGFGRYLYRFGEMWVDIDEFKRPREFPALSSWALPQGNCAITCCTNC